MGNTNTLKSSLVALAMMTGCSGPLDHKIPANVEAWKTDAGLKDVADELSDEDRELLGRWMMAQIMEKAFAEGFKNKGPKNPLDAGPTVESITVGEALDNQRKGEALVAQHKREQEAKEAAEAAESARLAERQRVIREAALAKLNAAVTVGFVKKEFVSSNFRQGRLYDKVYFTLAFENTSNQDIAAIEGDTLFTDILGNKLYSGSLSDTDGIPHGKTTSGAWGVKVEGFRAPTGMKITEFEKMRFTFTPTKIVFSDTTELVAP